MKKTITFFPTQAAKMLLATLLLTLTAQTARAEEYEISTLEELREFMEAVHVEDFAGDDIRLTADIDCEGGRFNTGDPEYPSTFRGTFYGQGHKIYNFVHGPIGYGEYGYGTAMFDFTETGAAIYDLTLEGTLPGTYSGAYSAAFVMAVESHLGLVLDNCHFNGSVTNVYHSAALVGFASPRADNMEVPSIILNNCSANANITTTSNNIAGGLVAKGTRVEASGCSFNGKVTSLGTVGGLIGEAINCILENCQVGSDFTLSDGATTIGKNAFNGCSGLTSIVIPASVTTIDRGAFANTGLTTVSFAAGSQLTSIGENAFEDCEVLTSITIPANVTTIGDYAFASTGLTSITIPANVTSIGEVAFAECSGLASVSFAAGSQLTTIGGYAFASTGLTSIEIPACVTSIGEYAFEGCSGLTTVSFAAGSQLTTIGNGVFSGCDVLTSITIPASVTSIGEWAFERCFNLATFTVYAPSCTLGENAFNNCDNLTNIYVLSNYVGTYKSAWSAYEDKISVMFDGTSTTTVSFDNDVTVNGVIYNRTFTASKPSTVMLPFSKDVDYISGGTFYTFGGVQKVDDKWVATMKEVTGSIEANTPYLFMPTGTSLTFTGDAILNTTGGGKGVTADQGSHWTFKGTYEYMKWTTETGDPDYNAERAAEIGYAYGFAGVAKNGINVGDFVKVASGAKIRPMGCYLLWNDTPNASRAAARGAATEELPQSITVRLVSADGETTAIGTIDNGQLTIDNYADADGWYDLQGRKLSGKPTKKGLYINNGKKIVIK